MPRTIPDGSEDSTRSIFIMEKSKLLGCIPLKTGTTNWQKGLAALMVYEKTGLYAKPANIPVKV